MPIRDVTTTWRQETGAKGLYVVRSTLAGCEDRVRVGAGGNHGGGRGLFGRLEKHWGARPAKPANCTEEFRPYRMVLRAWALDGWSESEVNDGEHCVYRPFLIRFRRLVGPKRDDSIFIVPVGAALEEMFEEAEADLRAMEGLRS